MGILTFEWILLISLLVIGIIGGLSAVRNALICELSELAQCITALNICDDCPPGGGCFPPHHQRRNGRWWDSDCDNP